MIKGLPGHIVIVSCFVVGVGATLIFSRGPVAATHTIESHAWVYQVDNNESLPDMLGYVVMDEETGEVLLSHEAQTSRPVASVIKLLVAAAAYRSDLLEATTIITERDVATPEEFGKLMVGETYTLRELLFPYLLESSNDAGAAIERTWGATLAPEIEEIKQHIAGGEAMALADFNGLDDKTSATPEALARLLTYVAKEIPVVLDITRLPQYVGQHPLVNNSPFIWDEDYEGGKHGYTPEAGKTALVRYQQPFPDTARSLVVVVLGASDTRAAVAAIKKRISESVTRIPQTAGDSAIIPAT